MGKKRKAPTLDEVLEKHWCYYCKREFEDTVGLHRHMKSKHFQCGLCTRKLNTAGGLSVHMQQVHKETLHKVENAVDGREDPRIEIFGIEGIPEDAVQERVQRITQEYYTKYGLPADQSNTNQPSSKKVKYEPPEEVKKRLAAFRAARAAGKVPGANNSDPATPDVQTNSPQNSNVDSQFGPPPAGSPVNGHSQAHLPSTAGSPVHTYPYGPPPSGSPVNHFQQQAYGAPPPQAFSPPIPQPGFANMGAQPPHMGFAQYPAAPHMAQFPMPFSPPPFSQYQGPPSVQNPFAQGTAFHDPGHQQNGHRATPPVRHNNGPMPSQGPPRLPTLPSTASLPPRPNFDAPPVSRSQLNEMHHGQRPVSAKANEASALESSIDDLISSAQQAAQQKPISSSKASPVPDTPDNPTASPAAPEARGTSHDSHIAKGGPFDTVKETLGTPGKSEDKPDKQDRPDRQDRPRKTIVFSVKDHKTPPEEKMAQMSRYYFHKG